MGIPGRKASCVFTRFMFHAAPTSVGHVISKIPLTEQRKHNILTGPRDQTKDHLSPESPPHKGTGFISLNAAFAAAPLLSLRGSRAVAVPCSVSSYKVSGNGILIPYQRAFVAFGLGAEVIPLTIYKVPVGIHPASGPVMDTTRNAAMPRLKNLFILSSVLYLIYIFMPRT